jgi:hypothetical protein
MRGTAIFLTVLVLFIVLSLLWGCSFILGKGV